MSNECRVDCKTVLEPCLIREWWDAATILGATRHHWAIENSFHWVLDMSSGKGLCHIRTGEC